MIHVIGAGPGDARYITADAREAIDSAEVVFAAARHAQLADGCRALEPVSVALDQIGAAHSAGKRVGVIVSGDASLYSLLPMLVARFGAEQVAVHPGIGAVQALCAALGVDWNGASILSAHGRALSGSALAHYARTNAKTIVFLDADRDARWVAEALISEGLGELRMSVCERLSYPDQRITRGIARELAHIKADPLSILMIENKTPVCYPPEIGIPDEAFIRGKVPMTKREVRGLILTQLRLRPGSVVWDIGAGTGSVSVECARQCPLGLVFAIERGEEALALIERNRAAFCLSNLIAVPGTAPDCLASLPPPTHVFIGGSGGHMDGIFGAIPKGARVVGSAVSMGGAQGLLSRMRDMRDFHMAQIAVSRVERACEADILRAQNPVFIASADWEEAGA